MPKIETWLNKKEYKQFKDKAQSEGVTEYALLKRIVKEYLLNFISF